MGGMYYLYFSIIFISPSNQGTLWVVPRSWRYATAAMWDSVYAQVVCHPVGIFTQPIHPVGRACPRGANGEWGLHYHYHVVQAGYVLGAGWVQAGYMLFRELVGLNVGKGWNRSEGDGGRGRCDGGGEVQWKGRCDGGWEEGCREMLGWMGTIATHWLHQAF